MASRFPEDTAVQFNYLPTLRAKVALSRNDPSKAIEILQVTSPYELGSPSFGPFMASLYPVYVRGQAYLALSQGSEAAAEFQKILNHRGVVLNGFIGALAHLGLAPAYKLEGDNYYNARIAYQDFLTLWKGADLDIPILKQPRQSARSGNRFPRSNHSRIQLPFSRPRFSIVEIRRGC